jgi:hypothetical protein
MQFGIAVQLDKAAAANFLHKLAGFAALFTLFILGISDWRLGTDD